MTYRRECLLCDGLLHEGGNAGRVCCQTCWRLWRKQHPGFVPHGALIAELFDRHWVSLGLRPAVLSCVTCHQPLVETAA